MRSSHFPQISDEDLVFLSLRGNLQAFDELVRRFRGAVMLVAEQTLGCPCAAEDVAQEAFLIALKALPQLKEPSKFGGWLCAITRHRARRVSRREGRSQATEASEIDRVILAHSRELALQPAEEVVRKDAHAAVRALLAELPPEYQTVLLLHYFEQWPVARIAKFLSLSITTVKWRLHQGRRLLRRQLAAQMEDHSDGSKQTDRDTALPPPAA